MTDRLPAELRHRFTTAFGLDISALRFHSDSAEAEELGVEAFTRGRDIHFAPGRFDPHGAPALIAHELAHVVQQGEGRVAPTLRMHGGQRLNNDAGLEQDADAAAAKAMRGEPVRPGAPTMAPRTVDVAQAYFCSDQTKKKLVASGRYCKQIYNHLLLTEGKKAADEFQDLAGDDENHGTLSANGYDLAAAQGFVAERVGQSADDDTGGTVKRRRVGRSGERGTQPGSDVVAQQEEEEDLKRKRRTQSMTTKPTVQDDDSEDTPRGRGEGRDARKRKSTTTKPTVRDDDSEDTPRGRGGGRDARKRRTANKPRTARRSRKATAPEGGDATPSKPKAPEKFDLATSTESPLTAWDDSQRTLDELAPHAPHHDDATETWRHYWTALCRDLGQLKGVSPESYEALLRGVTAVMLYKIHVASARSLDVSIEGGDIRQEAPQDRDDANVYYRSQDKGHPVITLYKDLITMAKDGVERGRILAPYNAQVHTLIASATPKDSKAKKAINTEEINGVLHRQKPPPKKKKGATAKAAPVKKKTPKKKAPAKKKKTEEETPTDEAPVTYGKKHTEMSAGYIGLRQNNADVIEGAVAQLFNAKDTFDQFVRYVGAEVTKAGAAPALPPPLALVDDHVAGVTSAIADLMTSLTMLSVGPGAAKPTAEPTTESTMEVVEDPTSEPVKEPVTEPKPEPTTEPIVEHMVEVDEDLEKAYLDPSYVVRKLAQASARADWIVGNVGTLKRLKVARTGLNPQITVQLLKHDDGLGDGEHITFANAVRVYFGALVTRSAVASGADLAIAQRQSFGFLDSSVTDTGEAFRISIGNEPSEMLEAIRDALVTLDGELVAARKDKPAERQKMAGKTSGKSQPLKTFAKSADAKYLGYWGALSKGQDLRAFLAGAPGISKQLAANTGPRRGAFMAQSSAQASRALGKLRTSSAKPSEISGPMRDELAIIEPLQNTLLMASDALTSCGGWDPRVLPQTRVAALADLAQTVRRGQRAVDHYAGTLGDTHDTEARVAAHLALRNVTEDMMEALVVFMATTETFTESPEDAMTELLHALYDMPVEVARTDGGEQAGAVAIAALRKEQTAAGKEFGLDISTSKSYFEYESFLKQNSIEHGADRPGASATFLDPRPYLTTVGDAFDGVELMRSKVDGIATALRKPTGKSPAKSGKGALPVAVPPDHTILFDVTNIDLLSREVTQLVAGLRDLIDANKLRVVLINSGVKHEQQGGDRYQVGRLVVIGAPLDEAGDTTDNSLIGQFLNLTQRLRMHDAAPVAIFDRGHQARCLLATAERYAPLIKSYGKHEEWTEILKTCSQVSSKDGETGSKVLDVGPSKDELDATAADDAALRGLRMIDDALDRLLGELKKEKPDEAAYKVFGALPAADQDTVRRALAPDTGSTSKSTRSRGRGTTSRARARVVVPALTPPGESTQTGVSNVGNTCYLSAGLSVLAATDAYYAMTAPVLADAQVKRVLRARVRTILDGIRGGQPVAGDAIEGLLDQLEALGLLPEPSARDRRRGVIARSAQHDLSEVMFRMLIDYLGAPDAAMITHVHQSDFRNQQLAPADGDVTKLSVMSQDRVLREVQREVLIELPIHRGTTLAEIIAVLQQPERVEGVRIAVDGAAQSGPALRSEDFGGAPTVLAFALKRFDFLDKDERPIDMPTSMQWNGHAYALQAVAYHGGASISGGHYTASTRGTDGQWSYRDDTSVKPQSAEHLEGRKNYGSLFTYTRGAALPPQDGPRPLGRTLVQGGPGGPQGGQGVPQGVQGGTPTAPTGTPTVQTGTPTPTTQAPVLPTLTIPMLSTPSHEPPPPSVASVRTPDSRPVATTLGAGETTMQLDEPGMDVEH